jgi:hypothetical protein
MTHRKILRRALILLALLVALPLLASGVSVAGREQPHWSASRWDSSGLAPDPAATPDAVVQVYAARLWGWRGALAVHTWIVAKPAGAPQYTRYEVVGWSRPALRVSHRIPDGYWAGNAPMLLRDIRGAAAADLVPRIAAAAQAYADREDYTIWPGPNSNSFTAHIARSLPGLGLQLPPTAIGKDWLGGGRLVAPAPSGTGWQVSLYGLAGVTVAAREGLELNLLGLTVGLDILHPAVKLPGLGRLGLPLAPQETAG